MTESRRPRGIWASWRTITACVAAVALASSACGAESNANESPSSIDVTPNRAAEKYCTDQGGTLVTRHAAGNTNGDPTTWIRLAGQVTLCEFESTADGNTTRISVDLVTLYSEEPTLAALAYLSRVPPIPPPQPSANPAAYNCTEGLHGADQFGNAPGSSGGWVDESQKTFVVMTLCVFADMSAIDEWGITYYSQGAIRGADLATKFRYQPKGRLPSVFVSD